jgi:hypothetical protein
MGFNQITLYPGNSQALRLDGLYDAANDVFPATATVTATLLDANSDPVNGLENLSLAYVDGTPSSYQGLIDPTEFTPAPGLYTLLVIATTAAGSVLSLELPAVVAARVT